MRHVGELVPYVSIAQNHGGRDNSDKRYKGRIRQAPARLEVGDLPAISYSSRVNGAITPGRHVQRGPTRLKSADVSIEGIADCALAVFASSRRGGAGGFA